nr:adenylate/guanylate cyclase domain-containing protein [Myxococcota bacterium]
TGLDDPDPDLAARLPSLRRSQVAVTKVSSRARLPVLTCTGLETNLPTLQLSGRRSGFLSALADPDGAVRRAALVARCADSYYVSLGLAVYEVASGQRAVLLGDQERLIEVRLGGRAFPVDEGGKILINYRGPPGTFPRVSAGDVLAGRVAPGALEGAIVLIGPTEVGLGDTWSGPFPGAFPGVEVHANVLDNLMAGDVIRRQDSFVEAELAGILAIGLLLIVVIPRTRAAAASFLLAGVLAGALLLVGFVAFVELGLWINLIYPLVTVVIVYGAMEATRSLAAEARSRRVRNLFASYVPPSVVKELAEGDAPPRLGGETRTLSILFSDVCDFTSLSERLGAEDTIRLMNAYLAEMTRVVFDTGGTLDKYIGDAVMAFWGAPLSLDDHALRAARAAVAMQGQVETFADSHPDLPGSGELRMGVGIHTAPVVVGNLGSDLRFDYTLIGDGVNLCSRLEGLTRQYRVGILASADLVGRLPPSFLTREIDEIQVKGREGSAVIHELLGEAPCSADERALLDAYAEGLAQYRAGRFEPARAAFEGVLALRAGDGPSETLLARMRELGGAPPEPWRGVWSFQSK